MKFNYNVSWKIIIDKNKKKKDLMNKTGISPTTISKMVKGESVFLGLLGKICRELDSDIGDIITIEKFILEDN